MSHYKPYPAYKDSGIEWIGVVPEHWVECSLKHALEEMGSGGTPDTDNPIYWSDKSKGTPWIAISDMSSTELVNDCHKTVTQAGIVSKRLKVFPQGTLLFSMYASLGHVAELGMAATTNQAILGLIPAAGTNQRFLKRWLQALQPYLAIDANNTTQDNLNAEKVRNLPFVKVPLVEQQRIAYQVDLEVSRIDTLISKKTRFIELLKEKRQALIAHAVTKGLNPNVRMKDSGVEWIGEVPEHWDVSKLGYVASEQGGKTPSTENTEYWDGIIPWVSPKDMKVSVISDSIDHITSLAVEECGMAVIPKNAVLAVVRGMILAHSFPVAETGSPVTINQDMKALVPVKNMLATYLRLVLQSAKSYVVSVLVAEAAHGTRVLRTDIWKQLPVVFPPVTEQRLVIDHIDSISNKYDKLASRTQRSIDLLKERRSALITAAVTGQIDLREVA